MAIEAREINLNSIIVENNTRKTFDEQKLRELTQSIRVHGVLQPIIVKPLENGNFGLVAGERRLKASVLAGKVTIPAVVRSISEAKHLEQNLVENLQQEALPFIETAIGIRRLRDESDLTVDEIARKLGKTRRLIQNYLKFTTVPDEVQQIFANEEVTVQVALLISDLENSDHQVKAANALRRNKKDKRIQPRSALAYIAENFGTEVAKDKRNTNKSSRSEYKSNWKKYLVRFSPEQFLSWKKWVAGKIDTETLAEAVEIVMMETSKTAQA